MGDLKTTVCVCGLVDRSVSSLAVGVCSHLTTDSRIKLLSAADIACTTTPATRVCVEILTVASLGLLSPGAETDGVTLFFSSKKTDNLFSHRLWRVMTFISCHLLTTLGDTFQGVTPDKNTSCG